MGPKHKQDMMKELGKGRSGMWFLGRLWEAALVRAGPSVLGSVLHQVCWS